MSTRTEEISVLSSIRLFPDLPTERAKAAVFRLQFRSSRDNAVGAGRAYGRTGLPINSHNRSKFNIYAYFGQKSP